MLAGIYGEAGHPSSRSVFTRMTGASDIAIGLPTHSRSWRGLSRAAKLYISVIVIAGLATLIYGGVHQSSKNIAEFICYSGVAAQGEPSRHYRHSVGEFSVHPDWRTGTQLNRNLDSGCGVDAGPVPV